MAAAKLKGTITTHHFQ